MPVGTLSSTYRTTKSLYYTYMDNLISGYVCTYPNAYPRWCISVFLWDCFQARGCSFIESCQEKDNYAAVNQMAAVVFSLFNAESGFGLEAELWIIGWQLWHLEYRSLVFHQVVYFLCTLLEWRLGDRDQDCTHHKPISVFLVYSS